jgi:MoaA/NifB/PqqE/SkfB family radical SAM enzyme
LGGSDFRGEKLIMQNSITKRQKEIVNIPTEYLSKTPPVPRSVKIELNAACNYNSFCCPYFIGDGNEPKIMEWDLFVKIASEARSLGVEEIAPFIIGEPFTNVDLLCKAISFLKDELKTPYVFLSTNGSLASPENVERVMAAGLDSLKWKVNFADWSQFTQFTGVPIKYFILAKRNIQSAWETREEKGYHTALYASSIYYDDLQLERIAPFLEKHIYPFVDQHYWFPFYSMHEGRQEIQEIYKRKPRIYKAIQEAGEEFPVPFFPWASFTASYISTDGKMTVSCANQDGKWVVGDLKTQTFMDCWHSDKFQAIRESYLLNIKKLET